MPHKRQPAYCKLSLPTASYHLAAARLPAQLTRRLRFGVPGLDFARVCGISNVPARRFWLVFGRVGESLSGEARNSPLGRSTSL